MRLKNNKINNNNNNNNNNDNRRKLDYVYILSYRKQTLDLCDYHCNLLPKCHN
jgi:hypothetical protein